MNLGIIGSDNSHAIAFSKLANLDEGYNGYRVPGVRVTHLYGTDAERNREVAEAGQIPHVVTNMEDMLGAVDGVICVWRNGGRHLPDTEPFLKAGIPAFVDKPLACTVADATRLIETAQAAKVGFTSFSTLRHAEPTVDFIANVRERAGTLHAGTITGPADLNSEHCGIFFYAIHAVELMNALFGYGCAQVTATEHNGHVAATCAFRDGPLVTLNLVNQPGTPFHLTAFGQRHSDQHTVNAATAYYRGMLLFVETLRTGVWPLTPDELLEPVKILTAINDSLAQRQPISIA